MAKKHVVEYFNKVANQYKDLLNELKDFEKECNEGLVEPERFDNFKKIIEPLKNNYMTWSYVIYLLNLPNRKSKEKTVKRRSKQHVEIPNTIQENTEILNKISRNNIYF